MRAILTYHSIDDTGSVISVSPAAFERQVRWLAASGVDVIPLTELVRAPLDRDAVAITFDDAYTNFLSDAWPRLRNLGLPVTLFVPTGFVGRENTWPALPGAGMPRLPILSWPALARLHEEGVTLGGHTRSHPDLRTLGAAAADDEIDGSFEDLRRETGTRARTFAYPYGFWNTGTAATVRAACDVACTTELRLLGRGEDPHLLPRLDSYYLDGPGRIERFGSASFREYFRLRAWMRTMRRLARRPASGGR